MSKFLPILLVFLIFLTGCGESIYSSAENTSSKEAIIDDFDFNFLKGNCATIQKHYDDRINEGLLLDNDDLYKYVSSILVCGGFDIVKGLDSVLEDGSSIDIYKTASAIIQHKMIDINTSMYLYSQYTKAINVCADYEEKLKQDNLTLNDTNLTLCGLAGTVGTIVNISTMILNASGGGAMELELTETGMKEFGQKVDPTIIGQGLLSFLKEHSLFSSTLNNGVLIAESAANLLGDLFGEDGFSSSINDLAADLRDSNGDITEDSLLQYIALSLNIQIPSNPLPPQP